MLRRAVPPVPPARRAAARPGRLLLGPLAAAGLALAACGGGDDAEDAATSTAAAGAVVEQSATAPPGAIEPAPSTADGKVAAGSSMPALLPVEYVYQGDMPVLDGPASAWRWDPRRTPTTDAIAAVASALGVQGAVTEQTADVGGGWVVGAEGTTRLTVSADAQGTWSLIAAASPLCMDGTGAGDAAASSPAAETVPVNPTGPDASTEVTPTDVATPVAPPETVPCVEPVGIPTADEARETAVQLLQALGLNPDGYEITADSQEWGAWVDARLLVDGIAAPVLTSFSFGAEGALTYASGQLLAPEPAGQYERTGTAAALAHLQADQFGSYGPGIDPAASAPAPRPAAEPAGPDTPVSSSADESPIVDSGNPIDTTVAPEPITVVLTGVEPGWWTIWADDGTVWLLPGYDFLTDQGERIASAAVAQIDMPVVETMTGVAEPAPGAGEAPAEPDIAPPLGN